MLFNSFDFLVFFAIVFIGYFIIPYKIRWILLLAASCIFYMAWNPYLILLIVFIIAVNYTAAYIIDINKNRRIKKKALILAMIINFGLLFVFKYLGFMNSTMLTIFGEAWPVKTIDIKELPSKQTGEKSLLSKGINYGKSVGYGWKKHGKQRSSP